MRLSLELGFTIQPIIYTLMFKISEMYYVLFMFICMYTCTHLSKILLKSLFHPFFTLTMNLKLFEKLVGLKKFVNLFLFNGI